MPPSMPQRLPCCAGCAGCAGLGAACCCAGFAGAGVTLRCAPTERPPPRRAASASVATSVALVIAMQIPSNHLPIMETSNSTMLSKSNTAMHGDHAGGEVEYFDLREARLLEHRLERRLVRMQADRLGEIAIGFCGPDNALAEPWQHLERVQVIRRLERRPDFGELEHHQAAAGLENARHLGERLLLACHVAQAESDGDAIEVGLGKRQPLGIALHRGEERAFVEQPVAP